MYKKFIFRNERENLLVLQAFKRKRRVFKSAAAYFIIQRCVLSLWSVNQNVRIKFHFNYHIVRNANMNDQIVHNFFFCEWWLCVAENILCRQKKIEIIEWKEEKMFDDDWWCNDSNFKESAGSKCETNQKNIYLEKKV